MTTTGDIRRVIGFPLVTPLPKVGHKCYQRWKN